MGKMIHLNQMPLQIAERGYTCISKHISFGEEESLPPKKPAALPEVAKQCELSGTLESESEAKLKKQLSDAKCKELRGHDIFAAPPEILPWATTVRASALKESIELGEPVSHNPAAGKKSSGQTATKTAKKLHDKKVSEFSGDDIFKVDVPPSSVEKHLSRVKLREMRGNDIFADGKVVSRWMHASWR